ncbi:MAG: nitrate reductase molybdenum cofactor assembly chaperone [Alphaproteobacteria bacterium]|nr:nitrate reductase molybdenum cofactor assembly chaperone [Alphaproteobacteria bacterium]
MANALKIISALLSYPGPDLIAAGPDLHKALAADTMTGPAEKTALGALIDDICTRDIYEAQERYVLLFDRTRALSLHLFEHVHGESRDRGQAMVDLATMYDAQGFEIDASELPDYLPLFLEYLSTQSSAEVKNLLGQTAHIIAAIAKRLAKRDSIYRNGFEAILAIADITPDAEAVADILKIPEDNPNDLTALDKIWHEEVVTFGADSTAAACGPERLRTRIRAANRPAPDDAPIQPSTPGDH